MKWQSSVNSREHTSGSMQYIDATVSIARRQAGSLAAHHKNGQLSCESNTSPCIIRSALTALCYNAVKNTIYSIVQ